MYARFLSLALLLGALPIMALADERELDAAALTTELHQMQEGLRELIHRVEDLERRLCEDPPSQPSPARDSGDVDVHVIGVYEGTYPPGVVHRGGVHPLGTVTVRVRDRKTPIILVLTACEPVLWKVDAPNGAITKLILSGYYKQQIQGLDAMVPVTKISYEEGGGDFFYAHRNKPRAEVSWATWEENENEIMIIWLIV
jgi:hypothetical protein